MEFYLNTIVELNSVELKFSQIQIQIQFMLPCNVIHTSISHNNEWMSFISKTFNFFLIPQGYFYIFCFLILLVLGQRRKIYCILHISFYHYYPLARIHLYQGYFNMSLTYECVLFN
jgi:hypothetical protein